MISELSAQVLHWFKVRKSKKQKTEFIAFLCQELAKDGHIVNVEETWGLIRNRNIIVGDVRSADIICGAHYDTPARLPIPNLITPKNWFLLILYQLFVSVFILLPALLIALIAAIATNIAGIDIIGELRVFMWTFLFLAILALYLVYSGPANPNNHNDNTSGTITLIEILKKLPIDERPKVAFVFFDNEEKGLIGSYKFVKLHRKELSGKLIVNFDCVSDGDTMLMVPNRKMRKDARLSETFASSFVLFADAFGKEILFTSAFLPSDQIHFIGNETVVIGAMRKIKGVGLYLGRIHTSRDVIFDERNIKLLSDGICLFICRMEYGYSRLEEPSSTKEAYSTPLAL